MKVKKKRGPEENVDELRDKKSKRKSKQKRKEKHKDKKRRKGNSCFYLHCFVVVVVVIRGRRPLSHRNVLLLFRVTQGLVTLRDAFGETTRIGRFLQELCEKHSCTCPCLKFDISASLISLLMRLAEHLNIHFSSTV